MTATKRRTNPQTISTWQRGRFTWAIRGPVRVIHPILQRLGTKWQWDYEAGAYLVSYKTIDDLLAALEIDGHRIDVGIPRW